MYFTQGPNESARSLLFWVKNIMICPKTNCNRISLTTVHFYKALKMTY